MAATTLQKPGDMSVLSYPDDGFTAEGSAQFYANLERRPEIIQGMAREGQIIAMGGDYGVGKSPFMAEAIVCLTREIPLCGLQVSKRPVIAFDFENEPAAFKTNLLRIATRHNIPRPQVPDELEVYLFNEDPTDAQTCQLHAALESKNPLALVRDALTRKPDALVFIDPPELLLTLDTLKKVPVIKFYRELRLILSKFPRASFWLTFNLRKRDRQCGRASLLSDPRAWLEEVCGSLDLMNRADVRLGMDFLDEEVRVVNGIRRGEDFTPLLVRPVGDDPTKLEGFEAIAASELELIQLLTSKQLNHWKSLPPKFTAKDAYDLMGKSNFSRLSRRLIALGVLEKVGSGVYQKKA